MSAVVVGQTGKGNRVVGIDRRKNLRCSVFFVGGGKEMCNDEVCVPAEPAMFPNENEGCVPSPEFPSQSDVDGHRSTHIPDWSWCRECVAGLAREMAHKCFYHSAREFMIVAMTYFSLTKNGGL